MVGDSPSKQVLSVYVFGEGFATTQGIVSIHVTHGNSTMRTGTPIVRIKSKRGLTCVSWALEAITNAKGWRTGCPHRRSQSDCIVSGHHWLELTKSACLAPAERELVLSSGVVNHVVVHYCVVGADSLL